LKGARFAIFRRYLENELRRPHQIITAATDDQILVSPAQSAESQQVKYLKGQNPRDTFVDNQEVFVEWVAANSERILP